MLAVYLDGYEPSVADRLIAAGRLPSIAALRERSARFQLEDAAAQRTGLAGEHFSSGLSPAAAGRWAAVSFDKEEYEVWQAGAAAIPFTAGRGLRTVVFDPTYFDLERAGEEVSGVVNWGAHDPGIAPFARPAGLVAELADRFGPYPASEWLYGHVWPSERRTRQMADALVEAVHLRARAGTWLLKERLPDWELGVVVSGELHSASEALWFGIDSEHPLNGAESSAAARAGLEAVYEEVDALIGRLHSSFADVPMLVFSPGGMGPNRSDIPSMTLLPELLYRHAFGRPLLRPRPEWDAELSGCPALAENENWARAMVAAFPPEVSAEPQTAAGIREKKARRRQRRGIQASAPARGEVRLALDWVPATRYRRFWPEMDAFALPSFYDGRVRLNLQGRERSGRVSQADYNAKIQEIEELVRACTDPFTGERLVDFVERLPSSEAANAGPTTSDLTIVWRGTAQAMSHPETGLIGPLPFNRTGGHTGKHGFAYLHGSSLRAGDYGPRSAFDVVPTILDMLGKPEAPELSGASLLRESP